MPLDERYRLCRWDTCPIWTRRQHGYCQYHFEKVLAERQEKMRVKRGKANARNHGA